MLGPYLSKAKKDDIFAKYSLTNFSLEKHATQNFYVFKLENIQKSPKFAKQWNNRDAPW
jgi:hypothetical protein